MTKKMTMAVAAFALMTGVSSANGVTYTWNGSANDSDWANTANWAGGVAPASLTATGATEDTIIFEGANMPTQNLATFTSASYNFDSASMIFKSGGTFNLDMSTSQANSPINNGSSRTFLTVGAGLGSVTVNVSGMDYLARHAGDYVVNYAVNTDGVLNFDGNLTTYANANKHASFTIDGGEVNATGYVGTGVSGLDSITFGAEGGSFSAAYGGDFTNFAALEADANGLFMNNSGEDLIFTDNGTTFTVTAIPEPATIGLLGLGGVVAFVTRRKRA